LRPPQPTEYNRRVTIRRVPGQAGRVLLAVVVLAAAPGPADAQVLSDAPAIVDAEQSRQLPPLRSRPPDPPNPEDAGRPEFQRPDFGQFFKVFGQNLTTNLVSKANLWPLAAGVGGAALIHPLDDDITDSVRDSADWAGTSGDILGSPITTAAVTGALLGTVPMVSNAKYEAFVFTFAQAYAVDTVLLQGLKTIGNRDRPNGEGRSFPSGHTSATFSAATVVSHYYGKRWGSLLYVLGTFVAGSRIEKGKHWASDVVGGAALGVIVGNTVVRGTRRNAEERATRGGSGLTMQPVVGGGTAALYFTRVF
jgi:membrane-associated phospholipid phosphatase